MALGRMTEPTADSSQSKDRAAHSQAQSVPLPSPGRGCAPSGTVNAARAKPRGLGRAGPGRV